MLKLTDITKVYPSGDVTALHGVSVAFRQNEFVSILGPSGCGKTTLLNIIGGLDRYTSGELCVRHVPTAKFTDRDWDSYRNHSIGFVFQSYNLIPHQSVLANVELALTLSGVSKAERRRRAAEALTAVGLADQMKKKPSQMSGGQMQRVAIARALVNDPDILLADEPTGALDSETSVQIMEILREVAKKKLIIMVTHNPDLAEQYSTRIIRVLDGRVIEDSNPYSPEEEAKEVYTAEEVKDTTAASADEKVRGKKRTSMSFGTALGLSLNNLMTKKTRTFLTSFAGSIGIIGIALILSLSNGINLYIAKVQEDTLSAYPIQINQTTVDMSSLMTSMMEAREENGSDEATPDDGSIHSNVMMYDLMDTMMSVDVQENNLSKFIDYIESTGGDFNGYASAVAYGYDLPLHIYSVDKKADDGMPEQLNPSSLFSGMREGMAEQSGMGMSSMMSTGLSIWQEMIDNPELMDQQYDLVAGEWPEQWNEVVLVVDENYKINDVYLYALGFKDSEEFQEMMQAAMKGENFNAVSESWTYDEVIGREFALVLPTDEYQKAGGTWQYMGDNSSFMQLAVENSEKLVISGIIKPNPEAVATSITGAIGYLPALSEYILNAVSDAEIVKEQQDHPETDVLLGLPFATEENDPANLTAAEKSEAIKSALTDKSRADRAAAYTKVLSSLSDADAQAQAAEQLAAMSPEAVSELLVNVMTTQSGMDAETVASYLAKMTAEEASGYALQILTEQVKQTYASAMEAQMGTMTTDQLSDALDTALASMTDEQIAEKFIDYMPQVVSESSLEENLEAIGWVDPESPSFMRIYAQTFDAKDEIARIIADYNQQCRDDDREEDVITYTDYVALMMSSISTIIDVISYVLIAFVSISLIVSSIMIGIITYISVLERTKEIGILRAVGASKRDISRVFNAETLIVGFASGAIGIGLTLLICIPANIIIKHLTDISNLAQLPLAGGIGLVLISMALTMIAGLIPSNLAAKKDPVEALRNE